MSPVTLRRLAIGLAIAPAMAAMTTTDVAMAQVDIVLGSSCRYPDRADVDCDGNLRTPQEQARIREQQAARAARNAEQERLRQLREARVSAEMARLGAHREAEIRRREEMRQRAEQARPDHHRPLPPCKTRGCVRPM
jgi:hypothetical protein